MFVGVHQYIYICIFAFDKQEIAQLNRQCGFIILLNSRLIELQLESKLNFPKLDLTKREEKLKVKKKNNIYIYIIPNANELFGIHHEKLIQEKAELEKKRRSYEKELTQLRPLYQLNQDLNREILRLREANKSLTSNIKSIVCLFVCLFFANADIRSMLSEKSRQYVEEIERQVNYYRGHVVTLVNEVESLRQGCSICMDRLTESQKDLTSARDEMSALLSQMNEMEERTGSDKEDVRRMKQEIGHLKAQMETEKQSLQWQLEHLRNEKDVLSEALSNERSKQVALEYQASSDIKYEKQIKDLQDQLSMIEANTLQVQDQWEKRVKDNQELADKFRAKYESVKQHIKTLELQHGEYTRVNEALKKQNNEFRQMITKLQQQLKQAKSNNAINGGSANVVGDMPNLALGIINPGVNVAESPALSDMASLNAQFLAQQEAALTQFKSNQKNDSSNNDDRKKNKNHSSDSLTINSKLQKNILSDEEVPKLIAPSKSVPHSHAYSSSKKSSLEDLSASEGVLDNDALGEGSDDQNASNLEVRKVIGDPLNPQPVQEIWGRKTKTISQKGTKKRVLVEWHFVTSDS
ncbi:viral A-type inclusion protein [Reticulomyxa filosa]|uniref:Viral A-type inclusion protein n=1 Tax=Reticulomyxa filosa TaxID=46433 RepID=X6MQA9_RETFI|nr:viral A-type inclusion protein [Reticulomyxa filosa]|eukprot:ETO16188.1 viral A-type inclusion protein [Reticulomyxa filosa]